jgi:hypothetical protein
MDKTFRFITTVLGIMSLLLATSVAGWCSIVPGELSVRPTVTINQTATQADPTDAAPILFSVVFSKSVSDFAASDVILSGTAPGTLIKTVSGSGRTYNVSVSGMTGSGTVVANLPDGAARDSVGNRSKVSTSRDNTVTFNVVPPPVIPLTATINQRVGQADPTTSSPVGFTVVFNKAVTNFSADDIILSGTAPGTLSPTVTGSGTTYEVTVSGMTGGGTVVANLAAGAAQDADGNNSAASTSTDNSVTFNVVPPATPLTVTINEARGQVDPTNTAPIRFSVVFSSAVSDFTSGDVTLSGTAPGTLTPTVTGSGTTYDVNVSGMTGNGTVVANLGAGVARNALGTASQASTSTDNGVTYDVTPLTVTVNQASTQADPTRAKPVLFTVRFSRAVTDFSANDVTLSGTAPGTLTKTVSGSGQTYNVSVSGMTGSGTVVANVTSGAARDSVGNANATSTSADNTITYDVTQPTVTINQAATQADPTNTAPIRFAVVFSEGVSGFDAGDIVLSGTAPGTLVKTVTGSGRTYTVSVSGMTGSGTVIANVPTRAAQDALGNTSTASTSTDNSVTYDVAVPAVTINQATTQVDPTSTAPIRFSVVFSKSVSGFAASDVTLSGTAPGTLTKTVTGSGTSYEVAVSGMTGSGTVVANMAAGAARDSAGNASNASTSRDNTITYDVTRPTVAINQAATQADPTTASPIRFSVVFGKTVTGFDSSDVTLSGTAPGTLTKTVTGSGRTYTVSVSGMTGSGTVIAKVPARAAQDALGNTSTTSTSTDNSVTFNVIPLTVTINEARGQVDPTNTAPIRFSVVFSSAVNGFTAGDVTLSGTAPGTLISTVTGSGTTYDVNVSGMTGNGTVVANLGAGVARNALGTASQASTSTDNRVTYDVTPLTVTVNQASTQADPTRAKPVLFTVRFSRAVTDFSANDVTLSGTAPGTLTKTVSGSGQTYNVSVSGMTGSGTVIANVASGAARDSVGNANAASTATDNTITYDVTQPTVTINQATNQADPTNTAPIRFAVVFSRPVSDFTASDVTLSGTAPGTLIKTVRGSGTTYEVAVSGMTGSGTVIARVPARAAQDALGNTSTTSTSTDNTVTYDVAVPAVTINQAATQVDPTSTAPIRFSVVFSEAVTGFDASDVALSGTAPGTLSPTVTGSGTTYQVAVSGMTGSGTVIANLAAGAAQDALGNSSAASTSRDNTVTYDVTVPAVTINQATGQTDPTNVAPILFSVVFSKTVTGFDASDVALSGTAPGTLTSTVTGSGRTYNVSVSGMTGSGTVVANLAAGAAQDALGNSSAASTSTDNSVTYDVTAPTVTIDQASNQADPTTSSPILFTVVFSKTVTGFDASDVALSGTAPGTPSPTVTGSGTTYQVAVSGMTGSGTVVANLAAGAAQDALGNASTASTSTDNSVTFNVVPPVIPLDVTINQAAGQIDPTTVAPIRFTVVFSSAVNDFTASDVTLSGTAPGTLTSTVTGSGTTYTVSVSGMTGSGTVIARLLSGVARDADGNLNRSSTSADNSVRFIVTTTRLREAATFGAFGGGAGITNQGVDTVVRGDIGTTAASSTITGFHDSTGDVYTETTLNIGNVTGRVYADAPPPVIFDSGGPYGGNAQTKAIADAAAADALKVYNELAALPTTAPDPSAAGELSGLTLAPGVYKSAGGSFNILPGGTLTLDAQGDPNASWVFQMNTSLNIGAIGAGATPARVVFRNGVGNAGNVYWQVGSSATINTGAQMVGTIIASAGISLSTAGEATLTTLDGRVLALNASVTMVNTVINVP